MGFVWDTGRFGATRVSDACILCVGVCNTGEWMEGFNFELSDISQSGDESMATHIGDLSRY